MKKLLTCALFLISSNAFAIGEEFAIKARGDRLCIQDRDYMPITFAVTLKRSWMNATPQ
jgi:hypothetical protein